MSEKEVDVVTCKGSDLLAFEHFINTQEENRVGWDNGFFKVRLKYITYFLVR